VYCNNLSLQLDLISTQVGRNECSKGIYPKLLHYTNVQFVLIIDSITVLLRFESSSVT
jgi:hypothetical protein